MLVNLSPVRMDEQLAARLEGDVLYLNGEPFDFSPLSEGATLPTKAIASGWFEENTKVSRINGKLELTLIAPYGPNAPEESKFPQPITVSTDGSIPLPIYGALPELEQTAAQEPEA